MPAHAELVAAVSVPVSFRALGGGGERVTRAIQPHYVHDGGTGIAEFVLAGEHKAFAKVCMQRCSGNSDQQQTSADHTDDSGYRTILTHGGPSSW